MSRSQKGGPLLLWGLSFLSLHATSQGPVDGQDDKFVLRGLTYNHLLP